MNGVNLGDSGCAVLRRDEVVWRAKEQTHYFNCPRQLAKVPGDASGAIRDQVSDGQAFTFDIEPGDSIVLVSPALTPRDENLPRALNV